MTNNYVAKILFCNLAFLCAMPGCQSRGMSYLPAGVYLLKEAPVVTRAVIVALDEQYPSSRAEYDFHMLMNSIVDSAGPPHGYVKYPDGEVEYYWQSEDGGDIVVYRSANSVAANVSIQPVPIIEAGES
jgi:hypothetical protein